MTAFELKMPTLDAETRIKLLESERATYSDWLYAILGAAGWDPMKQDPREAIKAICERLRSEQAP